MKKADVPLEIFAAISAMVADRHHLRKDYADVWVEDVLAKWDKSVYWANVSTCAKEFFGPIVDALLPSIRSLLDASVNAAFAHAQLINDPVDAIDAIREKGYGNSHN
jgi:hypothetical protein